MSVASRRVLNDEQRYWRVNQFMFPYYSLVPPMSKYPELSGQPPKVIEGSRSTIRIPG